MDKKEENKKLSVTKSNQLSTASYYLTAEEQRLILACIGKVNPMNHDGFDPLKKYTVTAEEFKNLFKHDKNVNIYQILKKVSEKLYNRSLFIDDGTEIIKSRWVSEVRYAKNEGYISLTFSPLVADHISRLKKNFNSYKLLNIQQMDSIYGIRIYELIMSLQGTNFKRTFKVDYLKRMLGIEDKYKLFADFNKKVLIPAQKDINEHSDINLKWEFIKSGRKVEEIKLVFKEKFKSQKTPEAPSFQNKKIDDKQETKNSMHDHIEINDDLQEWFSEDVEFNPES